MGVARSRAFLVLLGLPGALIAACGGAVVPNEADPTSSETPSSRPKPSRPPRDASKPDVAVDAAPGDCACTEEIPQIPGTCSFTIGPRLVACVAEHSADAGYVTLDLWRSCLSQDAPPSWSPSAKSTELDLCSCVPGEKHTLCLRYLD
jgi:hypothetical protein